MFIGREIYTRLIRAETSILKVLRRIELRQIAIEGKLYSMGIREDAADARFGELLGMVRDADRAKDVEIETLKVALANADQTAQARVDEALDADSEHDAERKEAGNAALEELLARASGGGDPAPDPAPASTDPGSSTELPSPPENEDVALGEEETAPPQE